MVNRRKYFVKPATTKSRRRQIIHCIKRMALGKFFRQGSKPLNGDILSD
jgi:hypothetical protein